MALSIRSGFEPRPPGAPAPGGAGGGAGLPRGGIERALAKRATEAFTRVADGKPSAAGGLATADRGDRADISPEARRLAGAEASDAPEASGNTATSSVRGERPEAATDYGTTDDLSRDEQRQVQELKARDREVRQHEQAHLAAAGDLASGGPSYTYQTGPDGRRYAVGGEVQIQLRESKDPQKTLQDARRARRAALAPAEPSAQDRRVASRADAMALRAQRDIAEERRSGGSDEDAGPRAAADAATASAAASSEGTAATGLGLAAYGAAGRSVRPAAESTPAAGGRLDLLA